jgi:hypothetical protein
MTLVIMEGKILSIASSVSKKQIIVCQPHKMDVAGNKIAEEWWPGIEKRQSRHLLSLSSHSCSAGSSMLNKQQTDFQEDRIIQKSPY